MFQNVPNHLAICCLALLKNCSIGACYTLLHLVTSCRRAHVVNTCIVATAQIIRMFHSHADRVKGIILKDGNIHSLHTGPICYTRTRLELLNLWLRPQIIDVCNSKRLDPGNGLWTCFCWLPASKDVVS